MLFSEQTVRVTDKLVKAIHEAADSHSINTAIAAQRLVRMGERVQVFLYSLVRDLITAWAIEHAHGTGHENQPHIYDWAERHDND